MKLKTMVALGLSAALLAGCDNGALEPLEEESLALSLAADGVEVMEGHNARPGNWVRRLVRAVHQQGDAAAQALLEEARAFREDARAAHEAGDTAQARTLMEQSKSSLFEAIVLTFPDAPERTGNGVDEAIGRITERLGDRDAPRIREILDAAIALRVEADAALAAGDAVGALDLNFQATRLLTRMVHFVRGHRDGGPGGPGGPPGGGPRGPGGDGPPEELSDHVSQLSF